MGVLNNKLGFDLVKFDPLIESPFVADETSGGSGPKPPGNAFLLSDGSDLLLSDGTYFLLS